MLEPVASPSIVVQLLGQLGSIVNALAIVGVAALVIWFGLRPAMNSILEAKNISQPSVVAVPAPEQLQAGASPSSVTVDGQPNLIADLTEKLGRTPMRRLEQMIDYDEDQAAAILKQWMRGAERA
jgi:flagellar M-ring protein FliF